MKTFVTRHIDVSFSLGSTSFENSNTVVRVEGLRIFAKITSRTEGVHQLEAEIYGLSPDVIKRIIGGRQMNISAPWFNPDNSIKLEIYTSDNPTKFCLFNGSIFAAVADFNAVPEVPLRITASETTLQQAKPITPKTFAGAAKVADIMTYLAGQIGSALENNGVDDSFILRDHTVQGSAIEAIEMTANAADIDWAFRNEGTVEDKSIGNVLIICKKGTPRSVPMLEIHEASGLVGYPVMGGAVNVTCLFNPQYWLLNRVKLFANKEQSVLNGIYQINSVDHEITSEAPDGQWVSHLTLGWLPNENQKTEGETK